MPWHYGNPLGEQRITEPTLVDRSNRAVIAVANKMARAAWAMLVLGFGIVGTALRRRRATPALA